MRSFHQKLSRRGATRRRFSLLLVALFLGSLAATVALRGQTSQNPHGAIKLDCQLCHVTENWTTMRADTPFKHSETAFPLEGRHEAIGCRSCHRSLEFSKADTRCFSCHQDVHENQFGDACSRCHSPELWVDESRFRQMHQESRFPLVGAHAVLDCEACHAGGRYAETPLDCYGCHLQIYTATSNPDHQGAGFPLDCSECHSILISSWAGNLAAFKHTSNFPLLGGHNIGGCDACHQPGTIYSQTSSECYSCHQSAYEATIDPPHVAENYPTTCAVCHSIMGWSPAQIDHNLTDFPLTGAHTSLNCLDCHSKGYTGTPTECDVCHHDDFTNENNNPIHTAPPFSLICTVCHNTTAWSPSSFNHNTQTGYQLTGAHVTTNCADCHLNGVYAGTSALCYSCHQIDFEGTTDPDHVAENYPTSCEVCHNTSTWDDANFDHDLTNFPLTGAHTSLNCLDCHSQGYSGTPTACDACHHNDFTNENNNPIHTAPSFSLICTVCHNTTAWSPSSFDHNTQTGYQLTGAHVSINCAECHANGVYAGTSTLCYPCHQQDYEEAENHVAENYPTTCEVCHNTSSWEGGGFDHNQTNFPLTGAHTSLNCLDCHGEGYSGTPTACDACHHDNFTNPTNNPIHTAPSFSLICTVCHNTTAWPPSSFNHNTQTGYPLTGAHVAANCALCHVGGVYSGTPTACDACHHDNFTNPTNNPIHTAPSFSLICTVCHSTTAWSPSSFNHNTQTGYPLTGAHVTASCALCHPNGQYAGTPTTCYFCHESEYLNTTDPNHQQAGFPTSCEICHTTVTWQGAIFDHDNLYFPIYSGTHHEAWNSCTDCHVGGNYNSFSCIDCHEHNQPEMNQVHQEVPGYVYQSQACFNCHPEGTAASDRRVKRPGRPTEKKP